MAVPLRLRPLRRRRACLRLHRLAVEMPGGVAEDRHYDREPDEEGKGAEEQQHGNDQAPNRHHRRIVQHDAHRRRQRHGGADVAVEPGPPDRSQPGGATSTPNPQPQSDTATPEPEQEKPQGQPVLVRFTDANGKGEDETVISKDFPVTSKAHPGYNAQGNIHFGPDKMLYLSIGDYDDPRLVQDLSTPVGKLLRIDPATGKAPPDNPPTGNAAADPRIYAYGFREPFDFAFNPENGAIYGTDNTPDTCEELNIIKPGANYGWPDVGGFPYADCAAAARARASPLAIPTTSCAGLAARRP